MYLFFILILFVSLILIHSLDVGKTNFRLIYPGFICRPYTLFHPIIVCQRERQHDSQGRIPEESADSAQRERCYT